MSRTLCEHLYTHEDAFLLNVHKILTRAGAAAVSTPGPEESVALNCFSAARVAKLSTLSKKHQDEVLTAVMTYVNRKLMLVNGQFTMEESRVGGFRGEVYNTRWHNIVEGSLGVGLRQDVAKGHQSGTLQSSTYFAAHSGHGRFCHVAAHAYARLTFEGEHALVRCACRALN